MYQEVSTENEELKKRIASAENGEFPCRGDRPEGSHRHLVDKLELPLVLKSRSSPDGQGSYCTSWSLLGMTLCVERAVRATFENLDLSGIFCDKNCMIF